MTDAAAKAPLIPVLERRIRSLTYLAGATALAVLLALLALWQRASTGEPAFKAVRMFPALEARVDDVAAIQIETKGAAFNITRDAKGLWHLPDKAGYPADFNTIRKTILGLSELDLIDLRTSRADWQDRLGLGLPKSGGNGTQITLKNAKGEEMASLVAGSAVEGAGGGGKQALYVRRPNEAQTYVARGNFQAQADQAQWLNKAFIDLAKERVKTATVKPPKGKPYSVTRATSADANFRLVEAIPAGRMLRTEAEPNGVGNALLGLSFDDVQPQTKFDFTTASSATYQTFDGLTLSLSLIEKDREFWMTVNAAADPNVQPEKPGATALKPDVPKEAKEINAVVGTWAYKIPRYKGVLLSSPMEDLLRPVGGPASGPSVNP